MFQANKGPTPTPKIKVSQTTNPIGIKDSGSSYPKKVPAPDSKNPTIPPIKRLYLQILAITPSETEYRAIIFKQIKKKNGPNSFPVLPIVKQLAVKIAAARKVVPSLQFSGTLSPKRGLSDSAIPAKPKPHKNCTNG